MRSARRLGSGRILSQRDDLNFGSLIVLAVTARRVSTGDLDRHRGAGFLSTEVSHWQTPALPPAHRHDRSAVRRHRPRHKG
jgi:hypothetical protein